MITDGDGPPRAHSFACWVMMPLKRRDQSATRARTSRLYWDLGDCACATTLRPCRVPFLVLPPRLGLTLCDHHPALVPGITLAALTLTPLPRSSFRRRYRTSLICALFIIISSQCSSLSIFWLSLFLFLSIFLNCTLAPLVTPPVVPPSIPSLGPPADPSIPPRPSTPRYRYAALACSFAVDPSLAFHSAVIDQFTYRHRLVLAHLFKNREPKAAAPCCRIRSALVLSKSTIAPLVLFSSSSGRPLRFMDMIITPRIKHKRIGSWLYA
ncbi:hypothetical protein C8R47DRAFT_675549 [Mycena vitilis]|nr:hypothetical protein C8R47DRAFT_675549 [Mycena vitilis]